MKIYLSNFVHKVARYLRESRPLILKAVLLVVLALFILLAIRGIVEYVQKAKYEKRIDALEREYGTADARAKEMEQQAELLKRALELKYEQLEAIQRRAETAETNLRNARRSVTPLKEAYEETRNNINAVPADTTCADACRELSAAGYACK